MLNKGAKGKLAEGAEEQAQAFRELQGAGNDSHVTQVLYGGGPALTNSGGQLWNAGYIDSIGEPTADLRSNIAAEARAKIIYERLINLTADAGVRDALGFLMTREISHQQSFEKALYAIQPNFPPGKLPGKPEFANVYVNTSQGEGDMRGAWNSDENFQYVSDRERMLAMDGGSGLPEVSLGENERAMLMQMAKRTRSNPSINPETGAELGSGNGQTPQGTRH
jgi:Mn-containing catalase